MSCSCWSVAVGWIRDHGGDVCELCALLPQYTAGAVQEPCRPRLSAEILQPYKQVH